jgi:hypothetical protein
LLDDEHDDREQEEGKPRGVAGLVIPFRVLRTSEASSVV